MTKLMSRMVTLGLAWLLCLGNLPVVALAAGEDGGVAITDGGMALAITEDAVGGSDPAIAHPDDCLMRSSFLGCTHLAALSAELLQSSSVGSDMVHALEGQGLTQVRTNAYYRPDMRQQADSIGVAVGRRELTAFGKPYTLLAVAMRSDEYRMEWAGNFSVGRGDFHQGFKAARDEVLRFLRHYVVEERIEGNLKLWVMGHSRGAAVASMVGGFLADGGAPYLGDGVSLVPQDIYCYAYATPFVVRDGASRSEELSVGGARGGAYAADTPGDAYIPTAMGTIDVHDEVYDGIRNYVGAYDLVLRLPPASWGLTRYGQECRADGDGVVSLDDMATELQGVSQAHYDMFVSGGDPRFFSEKTLDVANLSIRDETAPDKDAPSAYVAYLDRLVAGMTTVVPSRETYVAGGYEDALMACGSLVGLFSDTAGDSELGAAIARGDTVTALTTALPLVRPLAVGYLSHATERLVTEGRATDEPQAIAIVLEELLEVVTGTELDYASMTVDDAISLIARFAYDHANAPVIDAVLTRASEAIPQTFADILKFYLMPFHVGSGDSDGTTLKELLVDFLGACAYGPAEGTQASRQYPDARAARGALYQLVPLASLAMPGVDFGAILGRNESGEVDGSASIEDLVRALLPLLMTVKDDDGNVVREYESLAQACDAQLVDVLGEDPLGLVSATEARHGKEYGDATRAQLQILGDHAGQLRNLINYTLFYEAGVPYALASDVRALATFVGCVPIIASNHYDQVYTAWTRALDHSVAASDHAISHVAGKPATAVEAGVKEHWVFADGESTRYFLDATMTDEVGREGTVIEPTGQGIAYRTHVQGSGWQDAVADGTVSGTEGKGLRLEALGVELVGYAGTVQYRSHVQGIGWESQWHADGESSGTQAQSRRIEAVQIKLGGAIADEYDVWYRVHAQREGWMGWAKNGAMAGTADRGYRLEAIQVMLIRKGAEAPGSSSAAYRDASGYRSGIPDEESLVIYRTHVQSDGWQNYMRDGETAGTTGRSLRLEAVNIRLGGAVVGGVEYRTHVQGIGWEKLWKADGGLSGTSGASRRLEAIQVRLTGRANATHDVWYRVHAQDIGWMGWAKDGEPAGTTGHSARLEALEVCLVEKGGAAPGTTADAFRGRQP